jgi:hypothetical protein
VGQLSRAKSYLILKLTNSNPNWLPKYFFAGRVTFSLFGYKAQIIIYKQKNKQMKKFLLVLAIGAFVASCNNAADSAAAKVDSTAGAVVDEAKATLDSAKATVDSTAKAIVDSAKAKVDSLKK